MDRCDEASELSSAGRPGDAVMYSSTGARKLRAWRERQNLRNDLSVSTVAAAVRYPAPLARRRHLPRNEIAKATHGKLGAAPTQNTTNFIPPSSQTSAGPHGQAPWTDKYSRGGCCGPTSHELHSGDYHLLG